MPLSLLPALLKSTDSLEGTQKPLAKLQSLLPQPFHSDTSMQLRFKSLKNRSSKRQSDFWYLSQSASKIKHAHVFISAPKMPARTSFTFVYQIDCWPLRGAQNTCIGFVSVGKNKRPLGLDISPSLFFPRGLSPLIKLNCCSLVSLVTLLFRKKF